MLGFCYYYYHFKSLVIWNTYVISLLAICILFVRSLLMPFSVYLWGFYLALLICGSTLWIRRVQGFVFFFHICRKHIFPVRCLLFHFYFTFFFFCCC